MQCEQCFFVVLARLCPRRYSQTHRPINWLGKHHKFLKPLLFRYKEIYEQVMTCPSGVLVDATTCLWPPHVLLLLLNHCKVTRISKRDISMTLSLSRYRTPLLWNPRLVSSTRLDHRWLISRVYFGRLLVYKLPYRVKKLSNKTKQKWKLSKHKKIIMQSKNPALQSKSTKHPYIMLWLWGMIMCILRFSSDGK